MKIRGDGERTFLFYRYMYINTCKLKGYKEMQIQINLMMMNEYNNKGV